MSDVAVFRCTPRESQQSSSVRFVILNFITQLPNVRRRNGSVMEKSRINVGDPVLVAEGIYANCTGIVKTVNSRHRTVTVSMDDWPGTMVKMSMDKLEGGGWREIKYPTSRTNDPIDW
jgi:transcription antitermination factor NusG